jgi:hypothetical protein
MGFKIHYKIGYNKSVSSLSRVIQIFEREIAIIHILKAG